MLSSLAAHFDGWNTMEGRHLVFAYVLVALVQGGYFLWIVRSWITLNAAHRATSSTTKKAARPV